MFFFLSLRFWFFKKKIFGNMVKQDKQFSRDEGCLKSNKHTDEHLVMELTKWCGFVAGHSSTWWDLLWTLREPPVSTKLHAHGYESAAGGT